MWCIILFANYLHVQALSGLLVFEYFISSRLTKELGWEIRNVKEFF